MLSELPYPHFLYISIYLVLAALGPVGRVGSSGCGDRGTVLLQHALPAVASPAVLHPMWAPLAVVAGALSSCQHRRFLLQSTWSASGHVGSSSRGMRAQRVLLPAAASRPVVSTAARESAQARDLTRQPLHL